jgi:general secretion pathway protein L
MMSMMSDAKALFEEWIAAVAGAVESFIGRYAPRPRIVLGGESTGVLTARLHSARKGPPLADVSFRISNGRPSPSLPAAWQAAFRGSRVETDLAPAHVLFRPLDFPRQAADFLDGMIRAQIDRLTPWTASEAVFGITQAAPIAGDRIALTLAATSKQKIQPLLALAQDLGAVSVTGRVEPTDATDGTKPVTIFERRLTGASALDAPRLLRITLLGTCVAALALFAISLYVVGSLEAEQQELQARIAQRRAALRLNPASGSAETLLARRKQTSPSSVMVLEGISRVLPDTTYVTELRIEGDKMQVAGLTQDAPSLIRLIEQSPQFTRATFFAPTTRAPEDSGERFHVEAHVTPYYGSGS